MKIRNSFGTRFRGTIAKDMVASTWKGHEYLREYVVPKDPKTELQLERRAVFRDAVAAWHALPPAEKEVHNREAKGMSGFNLFVSRFIGGGGRQKPPRKQTPPGKRTLPTPGVLHRPPPRAFAPARVPNP